MTDEQLIDLWMNRKWKQPPPVRKSSGDYQWDGVLMSVFFTPDDKIRAVVAHRADTGHVLHIYSAAQLEAIK